MAQPPFPLMRLLFLEHCDFLLGLLALFLADMLYDYLCLLCYRLFVRIVEMVETPLPRIGLLCSDVLASPPAGTQYIESSGETDEGWQVHSTALGNGTRWRHNGRSSCCPFFHRKIIRKLPYTAVASRRRAPCSISPCIISQTFIQSIRMEIFSLFTALVKENCVDKLKDTACG